MNILICSLIKYKFFLFSSNLIMVISQTKNFSVESLSLRDLLNENIENLSEYLFLSIENLGQEVKISVTTVEDNPLTYTDVLSGVQGPYFQNLLIPKKG